MDTATDLTRLRAELAVMSIFRNLGIPASCSLPLAELERRWPEYGVRASDLHWAIGALDRRGFLDRRAGEPELITLTLAGKNWFDQQSGYLEYMLIVPRISRARFLRHHGMGRQVAMRRRRRDDSAALRENA